ncbi:MAG: hypothetical protein ACRC8S_02895 [Fimbriiglobus sp.]
MKLYIGSILGGPEVSGDPIARYIQRISRAASSLQEQHEFNSDGSLDLVYHVPGQIWKPDFEGLRTGKFSRQNRMLMIQMAVPELFDSDQQRKRFMVECLREAVALARPVFKKTAIDFRAEEFLRLIDLIETTTDQPEF